MAGPSTRLTPIVTLNVKVADKVKPLAVHKSEPRRDTLFEPRVRCSQLDHADEALGLSVCKNQSREKQSLGAEHGFQATPLTTAKNAAGLGAAVVQNGSQDNLLGTLARLMRSRPRQPGDAMQM